MCKWQDRQISLKKKKSLKRLEIPRSKHERLIKLSLDLLSLQLAARQQV